MLLQAPSEHYAQAIAKLDDHWQVATAGVHIMQVQAIE